MDYQPKHPRGTPKGTPKLPRAYSFKEIPTKKKIVIGVFQGNRGANPDLDVIIKYQEPEQQVRTPKHLHWTIDLLIKKEHNRTLTLEFIKFFLDMWDKVKPFTTKAEQQECELTESTDAYLKRFESLDQYGEYSVEFISKVIELLMIQEKTGLKEAFMFKDLLQAIYDEKDIFSIVSAASYNGR